MKKIRFALILFLTMSLVITTLVPAQAYPGNSAVSAAAEGSGSMPVPLPHDCDGTPNACCIFGYIFDGDVPIAGADVVLKNGSATLPLITAQNSQDPDNSLPYYHASLSTPTAFAVVGDVITITASYQARSVSRTWKVRSGGQHVDLKLSAPQPAAPGTGTVDWIEQAPMPVHVSNFAYVLLGGKFYVIGGNRIGGADSSALTAVQRYDPATNSWETDTGHGGALAPLPQARALNFAGVIHGKIHVMGGWDTNMGYRSEHFIYDPVANQWTTGPALPQAPIGQFAAIWNDSIYVFGGWAGAYSSTVYQYTDEAGWSAPKRAMPTARNHGTTAIYNGKIYAIGGEVGGQPASVVEAYDPVADTWQTGLPGLPAADFWMGASGMPVLSGKIYVLGPGTAGYAYDPQAGSWETLNALPAQVYTAAEINGSIFAFGPEHIYQGVTGAWPMYRQNPQHNGRSPYAGPQANTIAWVRSLGSSILSSPAILKNGTIVVGSENGKLYAFTSDGDFLWAFATGGGVTSSPAVGQDQSIYFGSKDGKIYAVTAGGAFKWSYPTGAGVESSPVIDPDGAIYVGSYDGTLYALKPDGSLKCSYTTGGGIYSTPAIGPDRTVYFGSNNRLYALNPDCTKKWETAPVSNAVSSSPALSADGKAIYYGGDAGYFYAANTSDGSLKWTSPFTYGGVSSSPAVGANGVVYVGTSYGSLWALNPVDGSLLWENYTTLSVRSSPAVGSDGVIYFPMDYGRIYAMNPDGSVKWTYDGNYDHDGHFFSSPAIGPDGKLYLGSTQGKLYAFGSLPPACGPKLGAWQTTASLPKPSATTMSRGQKLIFYQNYAYVLGGWSETNDRLTSTYFSAIQPDGALGSWIETTPLPDQFFDQVAVRVGKNLYVFSGGNGANAVYYAPIHADGTLGAWTGTTPMTSSRQEFGLAAAGEYIYLAGGNSGGMIDLVQYASVRPDGSLSEWTTTTPLPSPTQGHLLAAYDGYLYVLYRTGPVYAAPIQPNGSVGAWTATSSLPGDMGAFATFDAVSHLFVLDGLTPGVLSAALLPGGTLGPWQANTAQPAQIGSARAGENHCFVYLAGGKVGTQAANTVYYARLQEPPAASFRAAPRAGNAPYKVTFTDQSQGLVSAWDWDFGDGGASGARYPEHLYADPGTYSVALAVSGLGGADTQTKTNYIQVDPPLPVDPPTAVIDKITWSPSYPDPAVQGQDQVYFYGKGDAVSKTGFIVNYAWTSSLDGQLSSSANFSIPAANLSVGTHTISFRVQDNRKVWSPPVTSTLTVVPQPSGTVLSLILVHRQKLVSLFSEDKATQVMNKLNDLAASPGVKGLVFQLDSDSVDSSHAIRDAYAAWDTDPTSVDKANAVTDAIKSVILSTWGDHPGLQYLVMVGDDRLIPFRRIPDATGKPESEYTEVDSLTTVGAALSQNMYLTDDFYGNDTPLLPAASGSEQRGGFIPKLGIGRLVETPDEMMGQITAYLTRSNVPLINAAVVGYGELANGARQTCWLLNGIDTDCSLIGGAWGRDAFINTLLNRPYNLISMNVHADHRSIATPTDDVLAGDFAAAQGNFLQSLFNTVGCHSGLDVPSTDPLRISLPRSFAQRQSNYVANTGFGWANELTIGYSDQLMYLFNQRLVSGSSVTVGQALKHAKQHYYLDVKNFNAYDEKILLESTLYGLPMTRYENTGFEYGQARAQLASADSAEVKATLQVQAISDGLTMNTYAYQIPPLEKTTTPLGDYYTFDGEVNAKDGQPAQPKYTVDTSFPQTHAHGMVFLGGQYADIPNFTPLIDQMTTTSGERVPQSAFTAEGWFPTIFYQVNALENNEKLVTLLGQFDPQSKTERLYSQVRFGIYYHTSSQDWTAPSVSSVTTTTSGPNATINVSASDASGIQAVIVTYTDNKGAWSTASLTERDGKWLGVIPAASTTQFFVQVVDQAGNVQAVDDKGKYFQVVGGAWLMHLPMVGR